MVVGQSVCHVVSGTHLDYDGRHLVDGDANSGVGILLGTRHHKTRASPGSNEKDHLDSEGYPQWKTGL